jgi:branched-chain amino acid transport system ATP-binding protein
MSAVLQVNRLCRSFGALNVTRDVDMSLAPGARTALIGPNGAGKTTLVNLISGSLKPSSGVVRFQGCDVSNLDQAARARMGLVRTFQVTRLFKALSVADNVRLAVLQRMGKSPNFWTGVGSIDGMQEEVLRVLGLLRLADRANTLVASLAYGEQRLVEIALAIAMQPVVLLLDEPAAGVPKGESEVIFEALGKLPQDMAVLLIEHDMDLVFRFARDIIVLVAGGVITSGTPDEVAADERVRKLYLGEGA